MTVRTTSSHELPWWLTLSWRARFTRPALISLSAYVLAVVGTVTAVHLACATVLSGEQTDDKLFGSHTQLLSVPVGACSPVTECPLGEEMAALVRAAHGVDPTVFTSLNGLPADHRGDVTMTETSWSDTTFPERYRLQSGHWPTRPGEVVVPRGWSHPVGTPLQIPPGATPVTVVGTYLDVYSTNGDEVLSAPGTQARILDALSTPGRFARRPDVVVTVQMDHARPAELEHAVADAVSRMTGVAPHSTEQTLRGSAQARHTTDEGWKQLLDRVTPITGWGPLLVTPFLFSLLAGFSGWRRFERSLATCRELGLPARAVTASATASWITAAILASLFATVVGTGLGAALRPWLQTSVTHPLSPSPPPWSLALLVMLTALLGSSVHLLAVALRARWVGVATALAVYSPMVRALARAAQFVVIVVGSGYVVAAVNASAIQHGASMLRWVVLVCLLGAVITGSIVASLRDRRGSLPLPVTLAVRRLHTSPVGTAGVAAVVMTVVALPLTAGIEHATEQYRLNLTLVSPVPEGHVLLGQSDAFAETGVPASLKRDFEHYTGLSHPIWTRQALASGPDDLGQGIPTVLDSTRDLERFLGHPLPPQQRRSFERGEILVPAQPGNRLAEGQSLPMQTEASHEAGKLRVTIVRDVPRPYQIGTLGFVSATTAERLRWPLRPGYAVYTDVGGAALDAATRAPAALGVDPRVVQTYDVPKTVPVPGAVVIAQRILAVLMALLAFTATWRHVQETRPYVETLEGLGVTARTRYLTILTMVGLGIVLPMFLAHGLAVWANELGWSRAVHDSIGAVVPRGFVVESLATTTVTCAVGVLAAFLIELRGAHRRA